MIRTNYVSLDETIELESGNLHFSNQGGKKNGSR
jgi:hypothetical protein